jgi:hypothetical protein
MDLVFYLWQIWTRVSNDLFLLHMWQHLVRWQAYFFENVIEGQDVVDAIGSKDALNQLKLLE